MTAMTVSNATKTATHTADALPAACPVRNTQQADVLDKLIVPKRGPVPALRLVLRACERTRVHITPSGVSMLRRYRLSAGPGTNERRIYRRGATNEHSRTVSGRRCAGAYRL
jgi:hypothetical protein